MDQYNTLTPEIISKLKAVSDHILTGDDINPDFSRDEMPIYGTYARPGSPTTFHRGSSCCYEDLL